MRSRPLKSLSKPSKDLQLLAGFYDKPTVVATCGRYVSMMLLYQRTRVVPPDATASKRVTFAPLAVINKAFNPLRPTIHFHDSEVGQVFCRGGRLE